jgi:hypothetical protein
LFDILRRLAGRLELTFKIRTEGLLKDEKKQKWPITDRDKKVEI